MVVTGRRDLPLRARARCVRHAHAIVESTRSSALKLVHAAHSMGSTDAILVHNGRCHLPLRAGTSCECVALAIKCVASHPSLVLGTCTPRVITTNTIQLQSRCRHFPLDGGACCYIAAAPIYQRCGSARLPLTSGTHRMRGAYAIRGCSWHQRRVFRRCTDRVRGAKAVVRLASSACLPLCGTAHGERSALAI